MPVDEGRDPAQLTIEYQSVIKRNEEWIQKMWCTYTMEYYSAIKKNEIMPSAAIWMDLEIIVRIEVSQNRNTDITDTTYMRNLKKMI